MAVDKLRLEKALQFEADSSIRCTWGAAVENDCGPGSIHVEAVGDVPVPVSLEVV